MIVNYVYLAVYSDITKHPEVYILYIYIGTSDKTDGISRQRTATLSGPYEFISVFVGDLCGSNFWFCGVFCELVFLMFFILEVSAFIPFVLFFHCPLGIFSFFLYL